MGSCSGRGGHTGVSLHSKAEGRRVAGETGGERGGEAGETALTRGSLEEQT